MGVCCNGAHLVPQGNLRAIGVKLGRQAGAGVCRDSRRAAPLRGEVGKEAFSEHESEWESAAT